MARRVEQTRRLANHTPIELVHKPHATQRIAFSRSPGEEEQDKPGIAPSYYEMVKSPRQDCRLQRGVGLPESVATNERRTKREWAIEILARRFVNQVPGDSPRMTPDAPNKRAEPRIAPTQKPVPTPQRPNG